MPNFAFWNKRLVFCGGGLNKGLFNFIELLRDIEFMLFLFIIYLFDE